MRSLTRDGLLQIKSSAIVQALRTRASMRLGSTTPLAAQPGMQSRSSFLPGRSSALRGSPGIATPHGLLPRGSLAQQQGSSAAGPPEGLGSRGSLALNHQRNLDMATRRAAMHSTQKLSSMRSVSAVSISDASSSQQPACRIFKEGIAADGPAAASPFLSVVLPTKE